MKIFRQSLRSKLIGVFLIPTLFIVSMYGFLAYYASQQGLEEELGERLVSIGQTLSAQWSDGFDAKQIARLDETKGRVLTRLRQELSTTRDRTEVRRVYLFDRDHLSLVDSDPSAQFGKKLYELEPHGAEIDRVFQQGEPAASVLFEGPDGLLYKTGFVPVFSEGEVVAAIGVEASAAYFDLLTNFASVLTVLALLAVLLVVLVGTVFSRRLVEPINQLVDAAHRLGRGDWEAAVETPPGEDEIAFLASAFEEMRVGIVQRDRQMQMMLSGIAHEVRNPLGGMELFCGLLAEDLRAADLAEDGSQMVEKVAKIQRELDYLERVVTDFLDFARNAPLELERFVADDFVSEVKDLLHGEVVDGGCTLTTEITVDGLELTADRQKLRRAVINVVRNAYQACSGTGSIRLVIRPGDEGTRVIEVVDNGPGIPDEQLNDILTPFFTTKEKGSGLGLALTQRIIAQHQGALEASSTVGEGTTIRFVLPFNDDVQRSVAAEVPEGWLG